MTDFSTLLISLDKDRKRRSHAIEQLNRVGIAPRVVTAVDGHDEAFDFKRYRHLSRGKWWDMEEFKPGAFACYLSHADCWRRVRDGSDSHALICEDDMIVNELSFEILVRSELPPGFDIIFLNAGTNRFLDLLYPTGRQTDRSFEPLGGTLVQLVSAGVFTDQLTPGSYGYFVSRNGAGKLLNLMEREKVCMGVDYAMVFGSLTDIELEAIQQHPLPSNYLKIYLDNLKRDAEQQWQEPRTPLQSYLWNGAAVFRHRSEFESSINHQRFIGFGVFQ